MSKNINELKQLALMEANRFKTERGPEYVSEKEQAQERANQLNGIMCPVCWVWDGNILELEKVGFSRDCVLYACSECEFEAALERDS